MTHWLEEEEELLRVAWKSRKYDQDRLSEIFQRSFDSIRKKAVSLGLPSWEEMDGEARLEAIRKALEKEVMI